MNKLQQARRNHESPRLINQHHWMIALANATADHEQVHYAAVMNLYGNHPPTSFELLIDRELPIDAAIAIVHQTQQFRETLNQQERDRFDASNASIIQKS